jgi:hypothetical protein
LSLISGRLRPTFRYTHWLEKQRLTAYKDPDKTSPSNIAARRNSSQGVEVFSDPCLFDCMCLLWSAHARRVRTQDGAQIRAYAGGECIYCAISQEHLKAQVLGCDFQAAMVNSAVVGMRLDWRVHCCKSPHGREVALWNGKDGATSCHSVVQTAVGRGGRTLGMHHVQSEAATNAFELQQQTLHGPTTPPASNHTTSQTPSNFANPVAHPYRSHRYRHSSRIITKNGWRRQRYALTPSRALGP